MGKNQLDILGHECLMSGKNRLFKLSGSSGIFAGAGFLPDLEKMPDSGQSRSRNAVQPNIAAIYVLKMP